MPSASVGSSKAAAKLWLPMQAACMLLGRPEPFLHFLTKLGRPVFQHNLPEIENLEAYSEKEGKAGAAVGGGGWWNGAAEGGAGC